MSTTNNNLYDLMLTEVACGNVTQQIDPIGNLSQFTYSRDCMFDRKWNDVNMLARGIIFDNETKQLVAFPFPKFFNYGEVTHTLPDLPFTISAKEDGSLGIIYFWNDRWNVATKGSFKSEQAVWAEKYLYANVDLAAMNPDVTYLVEIVYPENRIVIRYEKEHLILIGAYDRISMEEISPPPMVDGFTPMQMCGFGNLEEIVEYAKKLPGNREGFVVRFSNGYRVKIKGDEYIKLHKMLSDFTPIRIWEVVRDCINLENYAKDLPEEFLPEFNAYTRRFLYEFEGLYSRVLHLHELHKDKSDKELGLWIKTEREKHPNPAYDFLFLARKKNWLADSLTVPAARRSAFDLFRPVGKTGSNRILIAKTDEEL